MVIRRVLLDAFGTIFSPRRPVHEQYAEVARSLGLDVEASIVKPAFREAYKRWATKHPLYGKHSHPPLTASDWWAGVITDTFSIAGVAPAELDPVRDTLTTTLIQRFWSREGYALHDDVEPFLSALSTFNRGTLGVSRYPGVVSGSDQGCIKVLESLNVVANASNRRRGIKEEEIWTTWEIGHEKKTTEFWTAVLGRLQESARAEREPALEPHDVLVVGDELTSDCLTPRSIGLRALLLKRPSTAEHANAGYDDTDRPGVETIQSLDEIVPLIRREYNE